MDFFVILQIISQDIVKPNRLRADLQNNGKRGKKEAGRVCGQALRRAWLTLEILLPENGGGGSVSVFLRGKGLYGNFGWEEAVL